MRPKRTRRAIRRTGESRISWQALLSLATLTALPGAALARLADKLDPVPLFGYVTLISVGTYLLYSRDKRKAAAGEWRIPEFELHFAELLGGWPAAFLAQRALRHKVSKQTYQMVFWLIVLLHQYLACDFLLGWRVTRHLLRLVE